MLGEIEIKRNSVKGSTTCLTKKKKINLFSSTPVNSCVSSPILNVVSSASILSPNSNETKRSNLPVNSTSLYTSDSAASHSSICSFSSTVKHFSLPARFQATLIMAAILFSSICCSDGKKADKKTTATSVKGSDFTYAVPYQKSNNDSESDIYRMVMANSTSPIEEFASIIETSIWNILEKRVENNNTRNKQLLGTRKNEKNEVLDEFKWFTYEDIYNLSKLFGSWLIEGGFVNTSNLPDETYQKEFKFVGIWSINRYEWTVTDLALNGYGMVSVPIYDTFGDDAVEHIFNQTKLSTICLEGSKINQAFKIAKKFSHITTFISFDPLTEETKSKASKHGINLFYFHEVIKDYKKKGKLRDPEVVKPDEIYSVVYTSGTTSVPKGVMISNRNMMAFIAGYIVVNPLSSGKTHTVISYLPLAHIAERCAEAASLYLGIRIGYYQGSFDAILDDFIKLKPTFWYGVPRVFTRSQLKIKEKARKGFLSNLLFEMGLMWKRNKYSRCQKFESFLWDYVVFRKIIDAVGGEVELVATGSAPTSSETIINQSVMLNAPTIQMWGMTEACVVIMQQPTDRNPESIGGPMASVEYKVVSVPDKNYYANSPVPEGELYVRGPTIMKGYLNEKDKTAEVLLPDGFMKTGDIVRILPNGSLVIIDRDKNIVKLQQGEYVAPEKIELYYSQNKYISQIFVHASSMERYVVALVYPNKAEVNIKLKNEKSTNDKIKSLIFEEMKKMNNLQSFEKPIAIKIIDEEFTIENGLLTPSFKMKRPLIVKKYEKELKNLYREKKNQGKKL